MQGKTGGGVLYMVPDMVMKVVYLVPLLFIWKILAESGYEAEMSAPQLLSYTYVNALLADLTIVNTCLSAWDYDARSMEMFTRPQVCQDLRAAQSRAQVCGIFRQMLCEA